MWVMTKEQLWKVRDNEHKKKQRKCPLVQMYASSIKSA